MATAIRGRIVRLSDKAPLKDITVEAIDISTGLPDSSTTTTDDHGFYSLTGLTDAVYFAHPLIADDDWTIQVDTNVLFGGAIYIPDDATTPRIQITNAAFGGLVGLDSGDTYDDSDGTGTYQFLLSQNDGKAYFGGGSVVLDDSGIALSGQLEITGTSIGLGIAVVNSGTGAGKSSSVVLQAHASGDDALTVYRIGPLPTPTQSWGVGIDNSDSDAFVIWEDELTPTNRVHIAVGGAVTLAKTLTANLGLTNGSVALDTPSSAPGIILRADTAARQRADILRTSTALLIRVRDSNNAATTPAITIADGSGDVAGNTTIHGTLTNTKTRSFFVPMSAFAAKVGAPSLAFVTPSGGAAIQGAHAWAFDSTNQEAISTGYLTMPVDWNGGNVTPYLYWTKAAAGSGNVVWEVIYSSISSGDAIDENATNNNAGATGYAVPGTAGNLKITQVGAAFDPGSANDGITLSIRRSPAAANDTYTGGDVWLVGVRLDYTAVM